jgi:dTDP-4-dehydrorhamnose reductase
MKIAVTGRSGQVVRAIIERAPAGVIVLPLGRPEFDLADPATIDAAIRAAAPDLVISAAAYTAVDRAQDDEAVAFAVNAAGAGAVAAAAARIGVPVIHLSTDYVFDGAKPSAYVETDPVAPLGAYGRSKLAGEAAVIAANPVAVIVRTAWVYSPFGHNFAKTMLRLARDRDELTIVADQIGNPSSALDIADGLLTMAPRLAEAGAGTPDLVGIFHMTGSGEASWADFAQAIMNASAATGGPTARVRPIGTADYPTPAPRPANSRLDCTRLARSYGIALPDWRDSTRTVVQRLITEQESLA